MENVPVDVEKILAAFQTLQCRVEHVIVEGQAVGWCRFAQAILLAIWPPR